MDRVRTAHTAWAAPLFCLGLALTACGGAPEDGGSPEEGAAAGTAADAFSVTDAWVKAVTAEEEMTAVFGQLRNGSSADITLVSASHEASGAAELHETATEGGDSAMREKEGGFVIPAGSTHLLEPGADHIMLMDLREDLEPGTEAVLTAEFSDGSTAEFTADVKSYAGANEEYDGGGDEHGGEH